mmetsp:Transcript_99040/g.263177  ORF Transcript_99040/g.263177 Transcript_99040/m.263177 type:complete len:418 (-) Transcript_99040:209-1462(-)
MTVLADASSKHRMGCKGGRNHAWSRPWTWSQAGSHLATLYVIGCVAVLVQPEWQEAGHRGDLVQLALFWVVFAASLLLYLFVCMADTRYREEPQNSNSQYESRKCEDCRDSITRLRVKHCQTCGKCTEEFDHHCHYLNVCIGGRTYTAWFFFVAGLFSLMLGSCYAGVNALAAPERYSLAAQSRLAFELILWVQVVMSLVLAAFLLCLLAQHLWFIYQGMTTLEYIKDQAGKFPSLPPKGWREAVRHGECFQCNAELEIMEVDDSNEVWFCSICQGDVGKAGVEFYSCDSCENITVCPLCFLAARQQDIPIVTYRVHTLRRRAEAQARALNGLHEQGDGQRFGRRSELLRYPSRNSRDSVQRGSRKQRRSLTAVVAAVEGHSGDKDRRACCGFREKEAGESEEEDGESGSSSDRSEG